MGLLMSEDMLNVMGSFISTELDAFENLHKELEEKDKEIERLNKLISQREKKWEKWTTEKQILSSKMSDYLCKYQNIKREYTKQIKISTDRKNEIERLIRQQELSKERAECISNKYNNLIKDKDAEIKQMRKKLINVKKTLLLNFDTQETIFRALNTLKDIDINGWR